MEGWLVCVQSQMQTLTHMCTPHQFSIRDSVSSPLVVKIKHMCNEVVPLIYSTLAQRTSC